MEGEVIDKDQVKKAVHALFQVAEKKGKSNRGFLDEGDDVFIQLTFQKVPDANNQMIKIPLPTSLMRESSDACLFVKDLDNNDRDYSKSVEHFKDLIESKGVEKVSEVIPLKMLKIEYQPYEAKRNLSNMYEFYLADERIYRLLPNLLGKNFYRRKRYPISVDLQVEDLKKEINKALNSTRLIISGRGSTSQITVAHTAMTEEQVVDNVVSVFDRLKEALPDGTENIKHIHMRTQSSPALPIFVSQGSANEIVLRSRKRKVEESEPEEISTLMDKKIKISPEGEITFYSIDGEPVEDENGNTEEIVANIKQDRKLVSKKVSKGKVMTTQTKKKSAKTKTPESGVQSAVVSKGVTKPPKEARQTEKLSQKPKLTVIKTSPKKPQIGKKNAMSGKAPKSNSFKEKSEGKTGHVKGRPKTRKLKTQN